MSSKKKRLAGRLAKNEVLDSGSWAFARRMDRRAISKVRNSGLFVVEPISASIETACVELERTVGEGGNDERHRRCSVSTSTVDLRFFANYYR